MEDDETVSTVSNYAAKKTVETVLKITTSHDPRLKPGENEKLNTIT